MEGITIAKSNGEYKGRKTKLVKGGEGKLIGHPIKMKVYYEIKKYNPIKLHIDAIAVLRYYVFKPVELALS